MGKVQNELNPQPKRQENNFALLGEAVPVQSHPTDKTKDGTSYATFIGAAVAAVILDFSRQKEIDAESYDVDKLKTALGMSVVFEIMAKGGKDGQYDCVTPAKLLGNSPGSTQEKKRKRIWDRISIALEAVDSPW
ncbi:hypothetical protein ABW20_dc0104236 [Dactylellina cionopaga]|nr:hypothetical protein ABW20_dc0104236 [Dactylellina cionopaga]